MTSIQGCHSAGISDSGSSGGHDDVRRCQRVAAEDQAVEIGQRHGLPIVNVMALDGTMNENAGRFRGQDRMACRDAIVEELDGTRKLQFKPGKLMAHIVLIDEDNRLSGKTKAAVLEGMEESSATLASDYSNLAEGKILPLFPLSCDFNDIEGPRFFMVICTENIFGEEEGTFANPVAQLDRTTLSINMLDPEDEADELLITQMPVEGYEAASDGASVPLSSMKSPRWLSSSSPMGVSRETGSWEILIISRTFSGMTSMPSPISSLVGSRPYSWTSLRLTRRSLLMVSTMWTGMRMVRAWSAMARGMA